MSRLGQFFVLNLGMLRNFGRISVLGRRLTSSLNLALVLVHRSMFLREWGIFAVRCLVLDHPSNQSAVDALVPQVNGHPWRMCV